MRLKSAPFLFHISIEMSLEIINESPRNHRHILVSAIQEVTLDTLVNKTSKPLTSPSGHR
ncbi:hypothetical protein PENANT_c006G07025 [Penicillium antarcticum]|uniref:Uncharacterized protein n=1 Tax=Penicillium antarcticum TaxID=416450 RepID=A0A1V6QE55_9EURO|nr:hypothetical protein PENANT_c006G07025 [Penicillium antarcticum]